MIKEILFNMNVFGKYIFRRHIIAYEGGAQESVLLRKHYAKNYNVNVGLYSYGGMFRPDFNVGGLSVQIGRYCSFASNIYYFGANHPIGNASLSTYFYNKAFGYEVEDVARHRLVIGNDVWIGYGVTITCNCHYIGDGAIIGAGSIITRDVPAYSVVAGNPGKKLYMRFDERTASLLQKSKWWELSPNELMRYYSLMKSPESFAKAVIHDRDTDTVR